MLGYITLNEMFFLICNPSRVEADSNTSIVVLRFVAEEEEGIHIPHLFFSKSGSLYCVRKSDQVPGIVLAFRNVLVCLK
jgi:hypothetical protein